MNEKIMEIDGWRVYDLPVKYGEADYDEARAEIVNQVKNTPELVTLFEYGCVRAPGISDMDFWAVFSDDAEKIGLPLKPTLSEKTKYLMSHQITLFMEKHYRKMLYFDPWTTYAWPNGQRLLYKKEGIDRDVNFEKLNLTKGERDILSLVYIDENLGVINSAVSFYARKELPVRHILETIKTCVYIIEEVNLITNRKINSDFSEDFKDLRSEWFEISQEQAVRKLIKLFYDGLLISFEAAFSLADWVRQHSVLENVEDLGIRKAKHLNGACLNSFGDWRIFTDLVRTPSQALGLSLNSCRKIKLGFGRYSRAIDFYVVFQPIETVAFLMGLVSEKGLLSDNLKEYIFSDREKLPVLKQEIFREKTRMINEITEAFNQRQIAGAGGKGWHFGNSSFQNSFEHKTLKKKLLVFWLKHKFWRAINTMIKF